MRPFLLALALALALTACGDETPAPRATEDPPAPSVSCGGEPPGWAVGAMTGGIETDTPPEEIEAALARTADDMGIDAPRQDPWIALAETEDHLTLGTGTWTADGPGADAMVVGYERTDEGLAWSGHGQCLRLAPVLPDGGSAWVALSAPEAGLDRSTAELPVLVMEHQCTGARDPLRFLHEPVVDEGPDRVVVSWTSSVPQGGATCPGNPWTETVLELEEPLGDRELHDGSTWPPTVVE